MGCNPSKKRATKTKQGGNAMSYDYSENECGSCEFLRDEHSDTKYFDADNLHKGHCVARGTYEYPDSKRCTDYKKQGTDREMYIPTSTGCYITTIVCDLMGLKDNCGILETLRGFRNNVMQKDSKYKETLYEYDIVGPQIAKYLMEDYSKSEDKEEIIELFNFFILPTVRYINEKNYPEAVDRYTQLTEALIDKYGIERVKEVPEDYDYTKGGHGVKKIGTYRGE